MAYRTRSARRLARQTRYNLLASLLIAIALIFATINWVLPILVNGLGKLRSVTKETVPTQEKAIQETSALAPPVIFIPYEATNSAKIDIRGFATARSKVRIFVDDELRAETDVESDGSFTAKNILLSLGTNSIYAKTVDEKNLESLQSKTMKLTYDNEKPPLELSEPQDNLTIKEKKIRVLGKTENNAQIFVNDVQVIVSSDGQFSKEQSLNDGENLIAIKAIDQASNSTETIRKVIVQP